jgi:hypothetical protein
MDNNMKEFLTGLAALMKTHDVKLEAIDEEYYGRAVRVVSYSAHGDFDIILGDWVSYKDVQDKLESE